MFKKPLGSIKTSAPLRSSDRRKLRQKVVERFGLGLELGEDDDGKDWDELVPEGILAVKFTTHLGEPGTAYLSPAPGGDPLWFTLGKGQSDQLIPTVYTLWRRPNLIPSISTPSSVIPRLAGGADLMIPGVVRHPPSLKRDQLVSITRHEKGKWGPPLAVGFMAVDVDGIAIRGQNERNETKKGKAVHVLHAWKDALFDQGSKIDPPDSVSADEEGDNDNNESVEKKKEQEKEEDEASTAVEESMAEMSLDSPPIAGQKPSENPPLPPQEVSDVLRTSLIHAITTSLSSLPPSSFPMPSTTLYSSHILPSRPVFCQKSPTPVDIKHSTHKSLTAFLRLCEKEGLLKLKEMKPDVVVVGTFPQHVDVLAHKKYESLRDVELKKEEKEERAEAARNKVKEMVVKELWKPHFQTVKFFEETGNSTSALYSVADVKSVVDEYVRTKGLMNAKNGQYVNVDVLLAATLSASPKKSATSESMEVLKRSEVVKMLTDKMQKWYAIIVEGKDPVARKGQLKPILVTVKTRQGGRKATTVISHYEPFMLTSEFLANELQRICASATTVTTMPGLDVVVMVQGRQTTAVARLLESRGVPKKWMNVS